MRGAAACAAVLILAVPLAALSCKSDEGSLKVAFARLAGPRNPADGSARPRVGRVSRTRPPTPSPPPSRPPTPLLAGRDVDWFVILKNSGNVSYAARACVCSRAPVCCAGAFVSLLCVMNDAPVVRRYLYADSDSPSFEKSAHSLDSLTSVLAESWAGDWSCMARGRRAGIVGFDLTAPAFSLPPPLLVLPCPELQPARWHTPSWPPWSTALPCTMTKFPMMVRRPSPYPPCPS